MTALLKYLVFGLLAVFVTATGAGATEFSQFEQSSIIVAQAGSEAVPAARAGEAALPSLTGRVVDNGNLLSVAAKARLAAMLAAFEQKSSDQVVVATIPSLSGNGLEEYANQLFRYWQLGQTQNNNGVLLLVARDDRKLRIEVGYGLEGVLTDALSKLIIETVIVPQFKKGDFEAGIVEGAEMIVKVLSGDEAELQARKQQMLQNQNSFDIKIDPEFIFVMLMVLFFMIPVGFSILATIFGQKLGKGRYRWLGIEVHQSSNSGRSGGGWSGGSSGGSSGGGFSGGGGSSGGGGASGSW